MTQDASQMTIDCFKSSRDNSASPFRGICGLRGGDTSIPLKAVKTSKRRPKQPMFQIRKKRRVPSEKKVKGDVMNFSGSHGRNA